MPKPTQSYEDRLATDRKPVFVWLSPAHFELLQRLCDSRGFNRKEAIEWLLVTAMDAGS